MKPCSSKLDNRLCKDVQQYHKIQDGSHKKWKEELTARGKTLAEVKL